MPNRFCPEGSVLKSKVVLIPAATPRPDAVTGSSKLVASGLDSGSNCTVHTLALVRAAGGLPNKRFEKLDGSWLSATSLSLLSSPGTATPLVCKPGDSSRVTDPVIVVEGTQRSSSGSSHGRKRGGGLLHCRPRWPCD